MKVKSILFQLIFFGTIVVAMSSCTAAKHREKLKHLSSIESVSDVSGNSCISEEDQKLSAFEKSFYKQALTSCASCHGSTQSPKFAVGDVKKALDFATPYFNVENVSNSVLYERAVNGHCGSSCTTGTTEGQLVTESLVAWATTVKAINPCTVVQSTDPTSGTVPTPGPVTPSTTPVPPVLGTPTPVDNPAPKNPFPNIEVVIFETPNGVANTGSIGIMNFTQVLPAMSAVTQIPISDSRVQKAYSENFTGYSIDGFAESISPALLLKYTTLASSFCSSLVRKEALLSQVQRTFFRSIDFSKGTNAYGITIQVAQAIELADQFWGRAPTIEETEIIKELFTQSISSINSATVPIAIPAAEKAIGLSVLLCTTILSSIDSIKN